MSFDDEMNDIESTETKAQYITEACVTVVAIKSYAMSPADHPGVPYVEFTFETEEKQVSTNRFFRVKPEDSPEVAGFKKKKLKELLENAGADFTLKGEQVIKSAIGLKVKALFKKVEYVTIDGNQNNKPIVKTKIEYSFSAKADDTIKGNQSYLFTPLNEKAHTKLAAELAKWVRDNPEGGADTPIVADTPPPVPTDGAVQPDDLPF